MAQDEPTEDRITRDRETIRRWAEEHGSTPVRDTSAESSDEQTIPYRFESEPERASQVEPLAWSAFFQQIETNDYIVIYYSETTGRTIDVIDRDQAVDRLPLESDEVEERLVAGETITSESSEGEETRARTPQRSPVETASDDSEDRDADVTESASSTGATEQVRTEPTDDDVGKRVVDARGRKIGMIEDVRAGTAYVDPEPGIVDRIKAVLDLEDHDDDSYPLEADQIHRITEDEVELSVSK